MSRSCSVSPRRAPSRAGSASASASARRSGGPLRAARTPPVHSSGTGDDGRRRADQACPDRPVPPGGTMTQTAPDSALSRIAAGDAPVLETLLEMNLDAAERSGLDTETYLLVRLAALVAMDAAPVSYLITLGAGADAGLTVEKAQAVL